ncbi:MAG: 2-succinyl-5-enolpyruvyl-6-hydroxy-3-cyclohexene-1-carboxylate synthase, partial [candidate division Zixibacteria bacterium]|nr:2-succinyl-5-enolpyruvyl-6-hydroxy-3-cyclohexene-1-carboxylate synthase [candidate division Zixibacteria bacterium]
LPDPHTDLALSDNPALATWRDRQRPFTTYEPRQTVLSDDQLMRVSDIINSAASGLLVVGRLSNDTERTAVERFARRLGWPVLPDISSGLRLGAECDAVIPYYDLLLQSVDAWKIARPAVALHLGGRVVSKRLMTFLKGARFDELLHVADHPYRHDWQHMVTSRLECSPVAFCEAVTPLVTTAGEFDLMKQLRLASVQVASIVQRTTENGRDLSEPGIARLISQNIPDDTGLFIGNSLSIRLMDSFADFTKKSVTQTPPVACNRGASGIDGTIAAAAGYAVGLRRPVTLLLGDLALLHDLNSLAVVRSLEYPMTIVLINNDGGGIFSLLPVAEREDIFEKYFATPHGLTFASSAEQ